MGEQLISSGGTFHYLGSFEGHDLYICSDYDVPEDMVLFVNRDRMTDEPYEPGMFHGWTVDEVADYLSMLEFDFSQLFNDDARA